MAHGQELRENVGGEGLDGSDRDFALQSRIIAQLFSGVFHLKKDSPGPFQKYGAGFRNNGFST